MFCTGAHLRLEELTAAWTPAEPWKVPPRSPGRGEQREGGGRHRDQSRLSRGVVDSSRAGSRETVGFPALGFGPTAEECAGMEVKVDLD